MCLRGLVSSYTAVGDNSQKYKQHCTNSWQMEKRYFDMNMYVNFVRRGPQNGSLYPNWIFKLGCMSRSILYNSPCHYSMRTSEYWGQSWDISFTSHTMHCPCHQLSRIPASSILPSPFSINGFLSVFHENKRAIGIWDWTIMRIISC